jgi:hypothetical protein
MEIGLTVQDDPSIVIAEQLPPTSGDLGTFVAFHT